MRRIPHVNYGGTIPRLLTAAAQRDPDGVWLRTDEESLTFAGALAAAAATARSLAAAGVRRGDLVVATTRNTPGYLMCWLGLAALGAVLVPVNPRSTAAELAGLVRQTAPRALVSDTGLAPLLDAAGAGRLSELGVLDVAALGAAQLRGHGPQAPGRRTRSRRTRGCRTRSCRTPGSGRTTWRC